MNVFYILIVFTVFYFALIWHDASARNEKVRENPDSEVLFANKRGDFQKRVSKIPVNECENIPDRSTNESYLMK